MKYFGYVEKERKANIKTCFMYWENLAEYIKFSETPPVGNVDFNPKQYGYQLNAIHNPSHSSFYDYANSYEEIHDSLKSFRHFNQYNEEKKQFIDKLKKEGVSFELNSSEGKLKKLDFNDLGLGVFCFSRAAMQLRRRVSPNGDTKIVSDVRKVYGYFPKKKGNGVVIRLMLPLGISAHQGQKEIFYNALPSIIAAEHFIEQGFDVEVYVRITVSESSSSKEQRHHLTHIIKIADSKIKPIDKSDIEGILIATVELRFFRTIGFLNTVKICDFFNIKVDATTGRPYSDFDIVKKAEDRLFPSENMVHQVIAYSFYDAKRRLIDMIKYANNLKSLKSEQQSQLKTYSYVQSGDASMTKANASGVIAYSTYLKV